MSAAAILVLLCATPTTIADLFERQLYEHLLSNYNVLARPVINSTTPVEVKLKLVLNQIVDVDEKSQTMQINVWLQHAWYDDYLKWNESTYGGVADVRFPSDALWKPDTLLYNSADANFDATHQTNFVVYSNGLVTWLPPGIVTFSCHIDTTWFPFDDQQCFLKFGSWTYGGHKLNLEQLDDGWDLSEYIPNGEWQLLGYKVTRSVKIYDCCPEPYPDLKFYLRIRRRTLYYGFNVILPSLLVVMATVLGFALPIESGEKITLEITILLSICVFLGMLTSMIPSTSDTLPLIGIYFAGNMIIVSLSIVANVAVLNLRYRTLETHVMSPRMRKIMLNWLPWLMMMNRPGHIFARSQSNEKQKKLNGCKTLDTLAKSGRRCPSPIFESVKVLNGYRSIDAGGTEEYFLSSLQNAIRLMSSLTTGIFDNLKNMTDRIRKENVVQEAMNDWRFAAVVFDRLCLIFFSVFLITSTCLIFAAPHYVDEQTKLATAF